jgi:hypothetical protein
MPALEGKPLMMDRRAFIGNCLPPATVLSSRLCFAADHKISKIGLQLYTVRNTMEVRPRGHPSQGWQASATKKWSWLVFEQTADGTVTYYKHTPQE